MLDKHGSKVLLILFFLPRLLFMGLWKEVFTKRIFAQIQLEPLFEEGAKQDGYWIIWAKQIGEGTLTATWEDMGASLLINALNKLGFSHFVAFDIYCILLMALGATLVYFLHQSLKKDLGPKLAFFLVAALVLYPRGIYFSSTYTRHIIIVYGFLYAYLIFRNASTLLRCKKGTDYVRVALLALGFPLLTLGRSTISAIAVALCCALLVRAFLEKEKLIRLVPFFVSLIVLYPIVKHLAPPAEHTFWHPVYRGLSNFDNKYKIVRSDSWIVGQVKSRLKKEWPSPAWQDPEYEPTLKTITLEVIKNDPAWYALLLAKRTVRLFVMPRSGGWLPRLHPNFISQEFTFSDLTYGGRFPVHRLYITVYTLSAILDLILILIGTLGLFLTVIRIGWRRSLPFFLLLSSVLYVYILIDAKYYDVYMAGTYVYLFFGLKLIYEYLRERNLQEILK